MWLYDYAMIQPLISFMVVGAHPTRPFISTYGVRGQPKSPSTGSNSLLMVILLMITDHAYDVTAMTLSGSFSYCHCEKIW